MDIKDAGYINPYTFQPTSKKPCKCNGNNFADALLHKTDDREDSYAKARQELVHQCGNYGKFYQKTVQRYDTSAIKPVETNRYTIEKKEGRLGGLLCIYDKERKETFTWTVNANQVQVDKKTGAKFLINDLGAGFFTMVTVDEELETGIKESLGVERLAEKELAGFQVHTDKKSGIQYITANGYESRGGLIAFSQETIEKLDSLAADFLEKYPNIAKSYQEAWFYASFEVRGLLKRTTSGIMMIGPNSLSFKHKNGVDEWNCVFDPEEWSRVKKMFDENAGKMEEWGFWDKWHKKLGVQ